MMTVRPSHDISSIVTYFDILFHKIGVISATYCSLAIILI